MTKYGTSGVPRQARAHDPLERHRRDSALMAWRYEPSRAGPSRGNGQIYTSGALPHMFGGRGLRGGALAGEWPLHAVQTRPRREREPVGPPELHARHAARVACGVTSCAKKLCGPGEGWPAKRKHGSLKESGGTLPDSPAGREPCQAIRSGSPEPAGGRVATATFPSSRPATNYVHRTGTDAPSQELGRHTERAIDPGLPSVVEKLHRHQEPPVAWRNQFDELDPPRIATPPVANEVGFRQGEWNAGEAEAKPLWPPAPQVRDSLRADAHRPLDPSNASREPE